MAKNRLRMCREQAGLTQLELAALAAVDHTTISDLERGKNRNPSHAMVTNIVRALRARGLDDVSPTTLFPVEPVEVTR